MDKILDEAGFHRAADAALSRMEALLEAHEIDFDAGDGIIEIDLSADGKIIVNRHGAAREIWLAARSGGYHFRWCEGAWKSARDGEELFTALARCIFEQNGQRMNLEKTP